MPAQRYVDDFFEEAQEAVKLKRSTRVIHPDPTLLAVTILKGS
jgi:hypothetical protein